MQRNESVAAGKPKTSKKIKKIKGRETIENAYRIVGKGTFKCDSLIVFNPLAIEEVSRKKLLEENFEIGRSHGING